VQGRWERRVIRFVCVLVFVCVEGTDRRTFGGKRGQEKIKSKKNTKVLRKLNVQNKEVRRMGLSTKNHED